MPSRRNNPVTIFRADGSIETARVGPLRTNQRVAVYLRDGYRCRYCGFKGGPEHFEVDHVLPVSMGGLNVMRNLVVACWVCNRYKGARVWVVGLPPRQQDDFDLSHFITVKRAARKRLHAGRASGAIERTPYGPPRPRKKKKPKGRGLAAINATPIDTSRAAAARRKNALLQQDHDARHDAAAREQRAAGGSGRGR